MADVTLVAQGDVLGERYVLRSHAWTSAIGPVWVARDKTLDRQVFVQMLGDDLAGDRAVARAFQKATARIAQVTHTSVAQVFDIGDGPPFAVLEHAGEGTLSARLARGQPMSVQDAARAALSIARGIEAMHERGVNHGSLSPSAILFAEEGRPKIFAVGAADTAVAAGRAVVDPAQPPGYRPPESDPIPADADRWALAALLYHMVTGKPPEKKPAPARSLRRGLPAPIDALLQRALSADPATRPSLDEFEGALAQFARVIPTDAREPRMAASEFRWIIPVIIIVGLAIAALTVGVQLARDLAKKEPGKPKTKTTAGAPAGSALTVQSIHDFDPPPGNGSEHPDRVQDAIDGDESTKWSTVGYPQSRLDGQKQGVGLLLDIGISQSLARVEIHTETTGWEGEIRVADSEGGRAEDFPVAAQFTQSQDDTVVTLPAATRGRYVLLWITKVVDDGSDPKYPWRATVTELSVFGG